MELLTTGAIAIGTLILKKAFEKTGDKLGEAVSAQRGNLTVHLREQFRTF